MKNIAKALVEAQKEMGNAVKGSSNPFFRSRYADLNSIREAVMPVLNAHGIAVLQPIVNVDGKNFVKTVLLHESGETLESFTEIVYSKINDAQAQGSGITYSRRYGLQSMVCVGADDDDGNAASVPQPAKKTVSNVGKKALDRTTGTTLLTQFAEKKIDEAGVKKYLEDNNIECTQSQFEKIIGK